MSQVGAPGRYQRSFSGMVGALVILFAVIVGFVILRAMARDDLETKPDHVDYLSVVRELQSADVDAAYPASLPKGWFARAVDRGTGSGGEATYGVEWAISFLTEDDEYAGVRQLMVDQPERADEALESMLKQYVDEHPVEGDEVAIDSEIADRWQTFTDAGGDTAYVAQLGEDWVMVYGSASADQLQELAVRLTTEPAPAGE